MSVELRPTPETDAACWLQDHEIYRGEIINSNFARKLERQRDEARDNAALWQGQLIESRRQADEARAELAKRDERLVKLEWRDVSVKPTREDACPSGFILATNRVWSWTQKWDAVLQKDDFWRPITPPPTLSPEEISRREFEAWHSKQYPSGGDAAKELQFVAWQAARAGKEGKR